MWLENTMKIEGNVRDSMKSCAGWCRKDGVIPIWMMHLERLLPARITLLDPKGNVLFDSLENSAELENHSNRPEFIQAEEEWIRRITEISGNIVKNRIFIVR